LIQAMLRLSYRAGRIVKNYALHRLAQFPVKRDLSDFGVHPDSTAANA